MHSARWELFQSRSAQRVAEAKIQAFQSEKELIHKAAASPSKGTRTGSSSSAQKAILDRLVVGERASLDSRDARMRTERNYQGLPEVVLAKKERDVLQEAADRRKKVMEMEDKRRKLLLSKQK